MQTNIENSMYVIPNNNIVLNHLSRKCSFCRCQGHNITTCNNTMLMTVNSYLMYLKNHFMVLYEGNRILAVEEFEKYLYTVCGQSNDNIKILRYVACRFYRARLRGFLQITINKILLALFDIDIEWLTFHEYNFVPFNEHTPIRLSAILTGILLNYSLSANNANFDSNIIFTHHEIKVIKTELYNENKDTTNECSICYESVEKLKCVSFECEHEYCINCVEQMLNKKHNTCPYCRKQIKKISCYTEEEYNKLVTITNLL